MRKIARAIGYSATSIYLYFESKDALFHALIDEGMASLYGTMVRKAAEHPDDVLARLQALCRCYVEFGLSQPEYYEIMFMLHPSHTARFPAVMYRRARRNLDLIAATLQEGRDEGRLVVPEPRVVASTIWATLHGAVALLLAQRLDARVDPGEFIETVIWQMLRSLVVADEMSIVASG